MRLRERDIGKLPVPTKNDKVYRDGEVRGFGVRVTPKNARSFVLGYSVHRRERRFTIGQWPSWNVTRARERAKELRRKIADGFDPLAEKEQALKDPTFGQVAAQYLEVRASKQKGFAEYKRILEKDALPHWRNIRAAGIRKRDVVALIEKKAETAPVAANRLFQLIRRLFAFALEREIVELNPCYGLKKPGGDETSRERALNGNEIRILWRCLSEDELFSETTSGSLKLMLSSAQREGEVVSARWEEIADDWWVIPGSKTKNGKQHKVPLNSIALEVLTEQPRVSEWVFPSPRKEDQHIHRDALCKALRRARTRDAELEKLDAFHPHDLRRSAATAMGEHGVAEFDIALTLNHSRTGVTQVYNRAKYDRQKRQTLDLWDRVLRAYIRGQPAESEGNLVRFPGSGVH